MGLISRRLSGALACVGLASALCVAECAAAGDFYLGPSAYLAIPDSELHAKSDLGAQLRIGYQFLPEWSAEFLSEIGRYDLKGGEGTLNQHGLGIEGVYHFILADEPFTPTIALGAGWMHSTYSGASDDVPLIEAGVGLNWTLSAPAWSVRGDVSLRHLIGDSAVPFYASENQNDIILSLGIQYQFGRSEDSIAGRSIGSSERKPISDTAPVENISGAAHTPKAPRCGNEEGLNACQGAPDQDGDGVPDTLDKCPDTPPNAVVDADGCLLYLRKDASH